MDVDPGCHPGAAATVGLVSSELPLVSVVVATFNRAQMIEQALMSVATQSYPRVQAIVVDDGSTDGTNAVVGRFRASTELPILYRRQENSGCAAARNAGVDLASGEFVAFLDSDDRWVPTAAEEMVQALLRSSADFVYAPSLEVFPDRNREIVVRPPAAGRPEAFAAEHFLHPGVRQGAFMLRRRVFIDMGGMDVSLRHNEDSDFVQRVAIRHQGVYLSLPTVRCYHHLGNKSADRPSIYAALLASNTRILEAFPEFAQALGACALVRLRDLRMRLVEELILVDRIDEARFAAAPVADKLPVTVRVGLIGRRGPLFTRRYVSRIVSSALARGRQAFRAAVGGR